jgi:hypothetical protein
VTRMSGGYAREMNPRTFESKEVLKLLEDVL